MTATDFPLARVRAQFPALERVHGGHPVAYFDGPGGTQVPNAVVAAMSDYLFRHNANTHWEYPTSAETDACLAAAREAMADLFACAPAEVAFGNNMTTLTYHVSRALGAPWGPGDEVVVTDLDHEANVAPWLRLAQERGVTVRRVRVRLETAELDWPSLESHVSARTKLIAIGAASNAVGTVNDVARAAALARSVGALTFVDAVHFAPHHLVDVRAIGCDLLACSPYKFYGPHTGVLYVRRDLLNGLDVPRLDPAPNTDGERLETGTQNHEGIVGAAAAVDFLASIGAGAQRRQRIVSAFAALHARGQALFTRMWDGIGAIPGVTRFGPPPGRPRTPTLAFAVRGHDAAAVARALAAQGVFVSHGDFYASTIVAQLGHALDGVVRAGCACYTSEAEVDRLVAGVAALAR
ncbi:MAG TPA: cysteine desulfurase-like protein [Gemmatimonadaceae bacterium]|nr:cysteine desulfurase-like protein [Gemmatimonadaceae bacterium]